MLRCYLCIGILLTGMGLSGCVSIPQETLSPVIQEEELSDHVHFLAQPALKGRKPFTWESRLARKYIGERFKAYGLIPWGTATSYAQPFVIGTNVIGVLPGSDPNLAQEFVILSAHYDHLGKTKEGLCVGACDNASGVAALLEIAEQLALSKDRPKRSICFAAFDQEETALLGAFAFTRRRDFDEAKIAGIVNIDCLGRNGFEVLENHLFVSGTEGYASLRNRLLQTDSGLQVLPVGTDIVGARGDHVAFETMSIPTLFFTCGPYEDYHKDSDTADKLDYGKIRKSTHIAFTALKVLADTPERLEKKITSEGLLQEISALQLCLDRIVKGHEALGWTQEQVAPIARFSTQLAELKHENQFDSQARRRLLLNNFNHLVPLLTWPQDDPAPNDSDAVHQRHEASWRMALANLDFRPEVIATGRAFIDHVNKHKSRLLWGVPDFKHMQFGLRDDYVSLIKGAKEESCLVFMPFYSALTVRPPGLLKWKQASCTWSFEWLPNGMIGTHDELVDACLLRWPKGRPQGVWDSSWQNRLSLVTGLQNEWTYDQWLQWRLDQGPWSQKDEWLLANMTSHNPYVANFAIRQTWETMKCRAQPKLCEMITDKAFRGSIRKAAIEVLDKEVDRSLLLALAQIVDDTSTDLTFGFSINDQHPLGELLRFIQTNQQKGRALAAKRKKPKDEQEPKVKPKTLGGHALKKLKELTGQDFGQDKQAWIAWIKADYHARPSK
jgi:hypothetical protein